MRTERERDGEGNDKRAADIAEEQEQNNHYQDDAFGQVVQKQCGW